MKISKWTFFQGGVLSGMVAMVFIFEIFSTQISTAISLEPMVSFLFVLTFIVVGCSLISLFLIFHSKKSDRFLSHPLWNKMGGLIVLVFALSAVLIISAFVFTSLTDFITTNRWLLYGIVYYFLFLANLFVLSIVHKVKKHVSTETKIELSFLWTVTSLVVLLFLFPSL